MHTTAIVIDRPGAIALRRLALKAPDAGDVVVETEWSGVSAGTEKLLWSGEMPPFPGLSYPLVPGYETVGVVARAGADARLGEGDRVFVPGASCYDGATGLFGANAGRIVVPAARCAAVPDGIGADAALLALAATAYRALSRLGGAPDLIAGHGALGRLAARLAKALGHPAPTVWETAEDRRSGARGYAVVAPAEDPRRDYARIVDMTGADGALDTLIGHAARGAEIVLAGFYARPVAFAYPPAFMREVRLSVSAEWAPEDLAAVLTLVRNGTLDLSGIITHRAPAEAAEHAYARAFDDPGCLKLVLDWRDA